MYVWDFIYICVLLQRGEVVHIYIYIYIYIHTHTHAHTYIHIQSQAIYTHYILSLNRNRLEIPEKPVVIHWQDALVMLREAHPDIEVCVYAYIYIDIGLSLLYTSYIIHMYILHIIYTIYTIPAMYTICTLNLPVPDPNTNPIPNTCRWVISMT